MNFRFMLLGVLLAGCVVRERVRTIRVEPALTVADVADMTRRGVPEDTILLMLRHHGMNRMISYEDIVLLKREGVGDRVIDAMIEARPRRVEYVSRYVYTPVPWHFGTWFVFWWAVHWHLGRR